VAPIGNSQGRIFKSGRNRSLTEAGGEVSSIHTYTVICLFVFIISKGDRNTDIKM
jgi:hypothetical protein